MLSWVRVPHSEVLNSQGGALPGLQRKRGRDWGKDVHVLGYRSSSHSASFHLVSQSQGIRARGMLMILRLLTSSHR